MTDYMPMAKASDKATLINNANKPKKILTREALESRIAELQVEVAKRQEMEDDLQEKIKSLYKCLSVQENKLIKYVEKPKEGDFTTIQVNPVQLMEVRKSQDELNEMLGKGMEKISLIMDEQPDTETETDSNTENASGED